MDRFVTLAAAVLDPASHTVSLVSAGHPAPLLYSCVGATLQDATSRDTGGIPLGILEGQEYRLPEVVLQPGDCLLLYTDGVPDAINVRREPFGVKGIHAAVQGNGSFTPQTLIDRIVKAVKQHAAGCPQNDDITLVCLGRAP
jgi:serine phosphatase RsbU (regulator of sigma subunit)